MRNKLLAIAAALSAAGAGLYFIDWNGDNSIDAMPESFGALEVVARDLCSGATCNAPACLQAQAVLDDAGSPCTIRTVTCPMRVGAFARALAQDAGLTLPTRPDGGNSNYQQLRFVAMRCAAVDGGFALGIPVDDAGWPVFSVTSVPHPCAWKVGPLCTRIDGGDPGPNQNETLQPGQWVGSDCHPKACVVIASTPIDEGD